MAAAERGRILLKLADPIEANAEELARLESARHRPPDARLAQLDVPRTAGCFRYFGGMADKFQGDVIPVEAGFLNYVLREPLGVVGQIVPWNFPLMFTSWKMAPALAAGNTVVLKPAELTPLSSLRIAELMGEVGFPPAWSTSCRASATRRASAWPSIPSVAQDRVHRLDRDGPARSCRLGRQPEAGPARARRQGRQHRVRRRQPRRGGRTARPAPSSTTRARPASPAAG